MRENPRCSLIKGTNCIFAHLLQVFVNFDYGLLNLFNLTKVFCGSLFNPAFFTLKYLAKIVEFICKILVNVVK